MKARLTLAIVLLSAAACNDEQKRPIAPTAPPISKSVTAVPTVGGSTVCVRYASELALAEAVLKDKPTSQRAQERVAKVDKLLKDACQ